MDLEQIVLQHIAQSREELRDPKKRAKWIDGSRAKEQAAAIVARIIADYHSRITGEITQNES
jgi:hypothetical protein